MTTNARARLVVGLTGGIGSGKTTAARRFSELGAHVIDADSIARELVATGSPVLRRIEDAFGDRVMDAEGSLDRAALRRLVFADPLARQSLEAILHPLIRERMKIQLRALKTGYAVLVIPLLVEVGKFDFVTRVLVVDAPLSLQLERASRRDGVTPEEIAAIARTQCAREERLKAADDTIDNNGDLEHLLGQVDRLHEMYCRLAQDQSGP